MDSRLEHLTHDYRDLASFSSPANILIHHFSIGSRASRIAFALPDRMVLVYHNITPPEYFVNVHPLLVRQCYRGRRELSAYAERCDLALGDSEFNRQELEAMGFPRTGVLPVVPGFSHLDATPDRRITAEFDDEMTNVIFVGRITPNKRIDNVIRYFSTYQRLFNPRSRLLLVGSYAGFDRYHGMLAELVTRLGTTDVRFFGHVTNAELAACYEVADIFLCASEHEGFCVPLVEAFREGIPVLAYAATAVPTTMDGAGILYDSRDPILVAGLVDQVATDRQLRERIVEGQDEAFGRLLRRDFREALLGFVERVASSADETRRAVAPDFWDQVAEFDRFEELTEFRPSLYCALPKAPSRIV